MISPRRAVFRVALAIGHRLPGGVLAALDRGRGIATPIPLDVLPPGPVVVVAPHPDDEVIGVGGTLRRHRRRGDHVTIVHVTSGEGSSSGADLPPAERAARREAEAEQAAAELGIGADRLRFLRSPDRGVDDGLRARLAAELAASSPRTLYAPWPHDTHPDHRVVGEATVRAAVVSPSVEVVAFYEVWTPLIATHVVRVDDVFGDKVRALERYRSVLRTVDYVAAIDGLSRYRSLHGGAGHGRAEALHLLPRGAWADWLRSGAP